MARYRLLRRIERERSFVSFDLSDDELKEAFDHSASGNDPFLDLARDETIDLVRQAVLSLPAHFREVIVLCYLQEMNYADAGEIIDCPIGTVRSRLARARSLLVQKLRLLRTPGRMVSSIPIAKTT